MPLNVYRIIHNLPHSSSPVVSFSYMLHISLDYSITLEHCTELAALIHSMITTKVNALLQETLHLRQELVSANRFFFCIS